MSAKDKNPTANHFVQLTAQLPTLGGMRRSGNAGSLPTYLFRDSENVALRGNDVIERGGQAKYNPDTVLDGCGDGFVPPDEEPREFQDRLVLLGSRGILGDNVDVEGQLWTAGLQEFAHVDGSGFGNAVSLSYIPGADPGGAGGQLLVGRGHSGADISSGGMSDITPNSSDQAVTVATYTDAEDDASAYGEVQEFDGQVYATHANDNSGVGACSVVVDPFGTPSAVETATGDGTVGGFYPIWLKVSGSEAFLVAPLEPATLHFLNAGSAGVWDTAAMDAGHRAHRRQPGAGTVLDGVVYFSGLAPGDGHSLYSWGGGSAVVTTVRTLAGIPRFQSIDGIREAISALCAHHEVLWYSHTEDSVLDAGDGLARLGKYNGSAFTDSAFVFPSDDLTPIRYLVSFGGRLWALRGDTLWSAEYPERFWRREAVSADAFFLAVKHPVY